MAKVSKDKQSHMETLVDGFYTYDPETGKIWWKIRAGPRSDLEKPVGSLQNGYLVTYRKICGKTKTIFLHRLAWRLYYGLWPDDEIDHINGDKTDNRINNLRSCNRTQNNCNRLARNNKTSQYLGVHWNKRVGKWQAQINIQGKKTHLGYYESEVDAAKKYDQSAKEVHKEFAKINGVV